MVPLGLERVSTSRAWSRWHRLGAAVAVVLSLAATFATIALIDLRTHEIAHADIEPMGSGRPFVRVFSVGTGGVVQLAPVSGTATSGRCVVSTAGTPVHLVNPGGAAPGEGPYCTDCAGGSSFSFPSSSVYVAVTSGTADIGCSFFDGAHAVTASGGGGGGLSVETDPLSCHTDGCTMTASIQTAGSLTNPAISGTAANNNSGVVVYGSDVVGLVSNGNERLQISPTLTTLKTPLIALQGTAAAPAISITGDTDSGIYQALANVIGVSTAGIARLWVSASGQLLPATTSDVEDIGSTTAPWRSLFLGTSIDGATNGKALTIDDDDGVSVTSSGKGFTVQPTGSVSFNMESSTTWTSSLQLPGSVYTAAGGGVSAPPCSSSTPGRVVYVDRTGDGVRAEVCVCVATAADVYGYKKMDDLSVGCDVVP